MKNPTVHFLITGGTIDSYYNGKIDTVSTLEASIIPEFIQSLRLHGDSVFTEICMKDSRQITAIERQKILEAILQSQHSHFIVTHGTYTMVDTARFLQGMLEMKSITNKCIVITGSMVPMNFPNADAPFNLGWSYSQAISRKPGVYVAMNGSCISATEASKDMQEGRFISLFNR